MEVVAEKISNILIGKEPPKSPVHQTVQKFPTDKQLESYKEKTATPHVLTTSTGAPIYEKKAVLTVGPRGPMLMQDFVYLNEMAHFDRERIPERVVHANGAGAHGYFEVTHDITQYTKADIFSEIGKKTPCFVRFSTVGGDRGSADTARDPRGFAIKFYTNDGNWDLVSIYIAAITKYSLQNNQHFSFRSNIFPSFIHTQKRNPQTHLRDPNAMFDYFGLRPESIHQVMFLFSDRGIPDGYRFMDGFGSHTFKLVNKVGHAVYCKFHFKCQQGNKFLKAEDATRIAGEDPDYAIRDLFNAIENGDFPQWELNLQIMTFEEAEKWEFNPFDLTKVWPHKEFPLIPVGRLVLNRNPMNYFAEVEQSAFCPAHIVPGIDFSPDRMLQGRIFSYPDTQFHRLGPNYQQLPINCPFATKVHNYQRDGFSTIHSQDGCPVYHPNSFNGPQELTTEHTKEHVFSTSGDVCRFDDGNLNNFEQPREFWTRVLKEDEKDRMVKNFAGALVACDQKIVDRFIGICAQVHSDFAARLNEAINNQMGNATDPKARS
ncbi:unnamed protein product, partial [Mesorhabditis belari]|uniref:Catalase n=1 Tax=Mesorhabditis belari TaxID=2138241 RepID=A0AAF3J3T6_9BILA